MHNHTPQPAALAWPATRAEGLARMAAFAPFMGRHYSSQRNYDLGPDKRGNVSVLSPYIRRRLITEEEAVRAALAVHCPEEAGKYVQEVFWRSYWKGWLEHRPEVWADYRQGRDAALGSMDRRMAKAVAAAEEGRTGIACFDSWAEELVETGYLHNHARMWFASIWIFTLHLPWQVGADFFLRHLLDGDPASNTLGWRWVAGLHTKGKHYAAQGWNIAKFTHQRFHPTDLNETAEPLEEQAGMPAARPVREFTACDPARPTALLITDEDCQPETLGPDLTALRGIATVQTAAERSPLPVSEGVARFDHAALADAMERVGGGGVAMIAPRGRDLVDWATRAGATQIVTAFVSQGPTRDWLDGVVPSLEDAGITLAEVQRDWDRAVWPHATAGFFRVKKKIPRLTEELNLAP